MERFRVEKAGVWRALGLIVAAAITAICLKRFIWPALRISAQAAGVALVLSPLCRLFERRFSRGTSAVLAVVCAFLTIAIAAAAIPLIISGFAADMQDIVSAIKPALDIASNAVRRLGLDISKIAETMSAWAASALSAAISAVSGAFSGIASMAIIAVLSGFMLKDRDRLLLHMEMMIPLIWRARAVRCAYAAYADILLYFRAQIIISLCVGALSAIGLSVIGVPQSLALGAIAGLFNVIPYLGPIIAAVPVAISAMANGLSCAVMAVIIMIAVQQIDGLMISPRVMGSVTGFSSAAVMIGVYCAGVATGIPGMLLILPVMIVIRTCVRVFVESHRSD